MSVYFIVSLNKTKHTVQTFSVLSVLNIVFSLDIVLLLCPKLDEMAWQVGHISEDSVASHFAP